MNGAVRATEARRGGDLCCGYGGLLFGVEKSANAALARKLVEEIVSLMAVLTMTQDVATQYGALRAKLEKIGTIIGNNDLWIATLRWPRGWCWSRPTRASFAECRV